MESADERLFQICRRRMAPATYTANNKTTMPTAATQRWTLSFCIVFQPLELFDSLSLEDCYGLCVGDAAYEKNPGVTVHGCS